MTEVRLRSGATPPPEGGGPCLLVHGGAWDIPDEVCPAHRRGLRAAIEQGRALLEAGVSALEVVTETVAALEADGTFDAGCGAMLNQDGAVELDAGLMDGATLAYGAVIGVRRVAHPVRLARRLLTRGAGQVRILAGDGAERFAAAEGIPLIDNAALICAREQERFEQLKRDADRFCPSHSFLPGRVAGADAAPRGTVGCVARDEAGCLAAATSTGGTPFKPPGRVGDSPLPGSGFYANAEAAVGATGWGEAIAAVLLAGRSADRIAAGGTPEAVLRQGLAQMHAQIANRDGAGATGGVLALDAEGRGAWAFTTPRMARGGWRSGGCLWVEV